MASPLAGGNAHPGAEAVCAIADYFAVSMDWLMRRPGAQKPAPLLLAQCEQLRALLLREPPPDAISPAERVNHVFRLWERLSSREQINRAVTTHLTMGNSALDQLRDGTLQVESGLLHQMSQFFRIPFRWFLTGEPLDLVPGDVDEYLPALMDLREAGITGADLATHAAMLIRWIEQARQI